MEKKLHILISGERGAGKSTLIEKLLAACPRPRYGFITKMLPPDEEGFHPIYIHPADRPVWKRVYTEENRIGVCDSRTHRVNLAAFNTLGVRYIRAARPGGSSSWTSWGSWKRRRRISPPPCWRPSPGISP